MKKTHFLKLNLLALLLINSKSYSQSDSIPVFLDAFNSFVISSSGFIPNSSLSIISGCPNDSFFDLPPYYPNHLFYINADIGAENGEALLNIYSKPGVYQNRDHRTSYTMAMSVPKIPLTLVYKYLYTDEYSDRFDSLWSIYRVSGNKMAYDEDGLRHEHLIAAQYKKDNLQLNTKYNWYRRWNATPYFFSPILSYGKSINPSISYSTYNISILSDWFINNHSEYYNHIIPKDFTDVSFTNKLTVKLSEGLMTDLKVQFDQSFNPESFISAGITRRNTPFHWNITGSVYNNYETSISGYGSYHFTPNVNCSLLVARQYVPESRPYCFIENRTPVSYKPTSIRQTNFYGSVSYTDTLFLIFNLNAWFQFNSDPLWESVTFANDTTFIRQMPYSENESVAGINAKFHYIFKALHLDCTPAVMFPVADTKRRFSIDKLMDFKLSYIPFDSNSISGSITLSYRDRSTLNYIIADFNEPMESFTSPSLTSIYLSVNVPFVLPFVNSFIDNASIFINAGPIRVSEKQRFLDHPRGNLIGPAIYAGIKGTFW